MKACKFESLLYIKYATVGLVIVSNTITTKLPVSHHKKMQIYLRN